MEAEAMIDPRIFFAVGLFVLGGVTGAAVNGWRLNSAHYQAEADRLEAQRIEADAAKVRAGTERRRANDAAALADLRATQARRTIERLRTENHGLPPSPVDPGCHLSAERVRKLEQAIEAAGAGSDTAQPAPAVPAAAAEAGEVRP